FADYKCSKILPYGFIEISSFNWKSGRLNPLFCAKNTIIKKLLANLFLPLFKNLLNGVPSDDALFYAVFNINNGVNRVVTRLNKKSNWISCSIRSGPFPHCFN